MRIYLGALALVCVLASCQKERIKGSGEVTTEQRTLSGFTKVSVSGSTDVHITQGDNFEVKVKAYANLLPYLETRITDKELLIGYKSNSNVSNDNSEVFITMPSVTGLSTSGSSDISCSGVFVTTDPVTAAISGSGNISIESGTAPGFTIHISGSGDVKSSGLVAEDVNIEISGSGDAEVHATQSLKARISGSGTVYYWGDPSVLDSQISGSGKVVKK